MKTIDEIETEFGRKLPLVYKEYVSNITDFIERYFKEDGDDDDYPGRPWFLWGESRLCEELDMRGVGTSLMYNVLALYTKLYADMTSENIIYSPEGKLSIERVASCFAFGEENGDYIYMDPEDNYSVWIYHHDGGDVKKISPSFEAWLLESKDA